jgi:hypothetical protein
MKKTVLALSLALATVPTAILADASQKEASNAIYEAVTANNKVAATGFEWRDTYKNLLGPAKQAYAKGDYHKAVQLANSAKSHAQLGLSQAEMAKSPHTL